MLSGSGGNDTRTGGLGSDTFVFNTALNATANVDSITDFNVANDAMHLDNAVMAALGATLGVLAVGSFWSSLTGRAHDADDRITYETDTGKVFCNADGSERGRCHPVRHARHQPRARQPGFLRDLKRQVIASAITAPDARSDKNTCTSGSRDFRLTVARR